MFDHIEIGVIDQSKPLLPEIWVNADGSSMRLRDFAKAGGDYSHTGWVKRKTSPRPPHHPELQILTTIGVPDSDGSIESHSVVNMTLKDAKVIAHRLVNETEARLLNAKTGDASLEVRDTWTPKILELYTARLAEHHGWILPDELFPARTAEAAARGISATDMRDKVAVKFDQWGPALSEGAAMSASVREAIDQASAIPELIEVLRIASEATAQLV